MAEVLPSTVQELVENGDELPQRYIWRDAGDYGPIDLSVPLTAEIPSIDVGRLVSAVDAAAELLNLRSALTSWGCFQVVNHGIDELFLDEVRQLGREFFHLPMSEKQKYARQGDGYEGYGNDLVLFDKQPLDWSDRLYLQVAPDDHQKLQYWPQNPQSFRKVLHDYSGKLRQIEEQLLKSIEKSLSIPEGSFLSKFGQGQMMYARFNYYPPCSKPDQVLALKPHADGSAITILLQDDRDVRGLQLLKDNHWFWVPIIPHALLVNIGDQLEILSNGICKSPVHRAVTNSERERSTVAMFCSPDPEKEIGPIQQLVDDEKRPRMFKQVKNFTETWFNYYQQGKRPIDAFRI
ncbi:2-oxoglutarate and oxygenase superfamily protein [Perilla frutescens var. hirtella]|uniref:2-oxoglutarate and oxygenase superfamily protein n=1 Tax=Perilla frutescens var. hirtella TaxID=608512 RepID=A0AAD4J956_PERFH|nr:2-oxoglutarate and oxygenase superfamily protein [Perilla frutescens var. hirtella]